MQTKLKVDTNKTIQSMNKKELIENIAKVLVVLKKRKRISDKTKEYLRVFLYEVQRTYEYKDYLAKGNIEQEEIEENLKDLQIESEFDKTIKSYFKGI